MKLRGNRRGSAFSRISLAILEKISLLLGPRRFYSGCNELNNWELIRLFPSLTRVQDQHRHHCHNCDVISTFFFIKKRNTNDTNDILLTFAIKFTEIGLIIMARHFAHPRRGIEKPTTATTTTTTKTKKRTRNWRDGNESKQGTKRRGRPK